MSLTGEAGRHRRRPPLLRLRNLNVEFPTAMGTPVVALHDIDLAIGSGEIMGLVGESGAGKTTLARSILDLPPAPGRITSGEIWFDGRNLRALPERELQRDARPRPVDDRAEPARRANPLLTVASRSRPWRGCI